MQVVRHNGTVQAEQAEIRASLQRLVANIRSAIILDPAKLELILAALLAKGHVLLEDVPGIGKTITARAIAQSLHASFKRIQCTPDLLPSDITGSAIYNQRESRFEFLKGAVFANLVLVDEINRASPRTQSSLLESMAEGQVSSDGFTHPLPQPFFIIATQNPIEMAGTFPLPEAQLDRFLIMLNLGYPSFDDEVTILEREEHTNPLDALQPVIDTDAVMRLQEGVQAVDVVRPVKEYIVRLNHATRAHPEAILGVSPRGGVALQRIAQALALIDGRRFVTPDDIKRSAPAVMAHRIMTRDRRIESAHGLIDDVLKSVPVPL
ncbi:MAG: AAA family ATPase [bacterium]|nr:AAA family ATPase [bacterium]